jgi:hypothetical protein
VRRAHYFAAVAPTLAQPNKHTKCPRKYTLGCVTITPSGSGETITFSCSGSSSCPVPKWSMYNLFHTVSGNSASKNLAGRWDPNPYYSGPSTHTINSIMERRALKPSNRVEYVETLIACPAQSSCTGLGTIGIIPTF